MTPVRKRRQNPGADAPGEFSALTVLANKEFQKLKLYSYRDEGSQSGFKSLHHLQYFHYIDMSTEKSLKCRTYIKL